jgi:hypothetical protein
LRELDRIDDASPIASSDRLHSGMTDLRVADTGHVAKEH